MLGIVRTLPLVILLGLAACTGIRGEARLIQRTSTVAARADTGGGGPAGPNLTTLHAKTFQLIVEGNFAEAIEYYRLATGVEQVPRWLFALGNAFSAANRVAGRCQDVANQIYEGFKQLGQDPRIVRIVSVGGSDNKYLSWQSKIMVSSNNWHLAVLNAGRIYDAFTGPAGMVWEEYQLALVHDGILQYTPMP